MQKCVTRESREHMTNYIWACSFQIQVQKCWIMETANSLWPVVTTTQQLPSGRAGTTCVSTVFFLRLPLPLQQRSFSSRATKGFGQRWGKAGCIRGRLGSSLPWCLGMLGSGILVQACVAVKCFTAQCGRANKWSWLQQLQLTLAFSKEVYSLDSIDVVPCLDH